MNRLRSDRAFNVARTVLTLLLIATPLAAQSGRLTYWGYVALGAGGAADSGFYSSTVGLGVQRFHILGVARVGSLDTPKIKRFSEIALMAGWATRPGRFHFGAVAGIGNVRDSRDSTAAALAYEAHAGVLVTRWAALAARVFGNTNRLGNFGGITLALQVGRLRW